jgi:amidase
MSVRRPTSDELAEIADDLGLHLEPEERAAYGRLVQGLLGGFALLDALPEDLPPVRYPRTPGTRPPAHQNPYGAWYVKTRVEGSGRGPLAGREVVLKDNVMLAGVPLMCGTSTLEGYVPPLDASIVTRILDAGGCIVGKSVCESYCLSGSSHTSATGPVRNPHAPEHSAGGSSSGSAALVASGEVDLAIGGDQGGSIRVPASFCGIYGMKPTWGLVPYTGILGMDFGVDHAGPMTAGVADNALLLEVIAGPDGLDARQAGVQSGAYAEALDAGVAELRIGVLREGFGRSESQPDVDAAVRAAAARLEKLGAKVSETSVPAHTRAGVAWLGSLQSTVHTMFATDGCGSGHEGVFPTSFLDFHRGWRSRTDELPETVKTMLLTSEYLRRHHGFRYVAKSMGLTRAVRAAYAEALSHFDLLLMPTTPMKAPPLPPADASIEAIVGQAFLPSGNTMPFDYTHHPAMSVPCGMSDGLPIGMMLVGRHFEESTIYRAARAFEREVDWRSLRPTA